MGDLRGVGKENFLFHNLNFGLCPSRCWAFSYKERINCAFKFYGVGSYLFVAHLT